MASSVMGPLDDAAGKAGSLFTRDATGLVKEISTKDAFNINMGMANPGIGFVVMGFVLALYPHADFTIPLIIGGIGLLLLVAVYVQLVTTMPRSGGDYIFVSRVLSPTLGASIAGAWLIILFIFGAIGAQILGNQYIPAVFSNLGHSMHNQTLIDWSSGLSGKWPAFLSGSGIIIVLGLLMFFGLRVANRILLWSMIIGSAGFLIVLLLLLFHSTADFRAAFAANNAGVSYGKVLSTATHEGWTSGFDWSSTFLILPYAMILYNGFTFASFPAGEIRRPTRTYPRSVILALGTCVLMYLVIWLLARKTMGIDLISAAFYVSNNPNSPLATGPSFSTYAGYLTSNWFVGLLVTLSFIGWAVLYLVSYYLVLSRILFALAFDRVLPQRVADVTQRSGAPMVASAIVAVGLIGVLAIATFTSYLSVWTNGTLSTCVVFVVASIAAAILPYRRRDLYEASPKVFTFTVAGIPGITVLGALSGLLFIALAFAVIQQSAVFGPISAQSIGFTIATFAWGALAIFVSRAWYRSRGLQLELAQRELPPE